jgi:hypothetical protein
MLTMKHYYGLREFCREIGCYSLTRENDRIHFVAYEQDEFGPSLGVWGGFQRSDQITPEDNAELCTIYVMNSNGSTIAKVDYWADRALFVEAGVPICEADARMPEDSQPEKLAA